MRPETFGTITLVYTTCSNFPPRQKLGVHPNLRKTCHMSNWNPRMSFCNGVFCLFLYFFNCFVRLLVSSRLYLIFTRRRSYSFAEYWKYFVARLNGVHAFHYNSAESEQIWMKFGTLRVYCPKLALAYFGRDPRRSKSERASRNFVFFCPVNNARLYQFTVSQISRNLHTRRG